MKWKKLGRIFENNGVHAKLRSHAANPLAIPVSDSIYRIFYSGRDDENRSSVSYFDFDLDQMQVVYKHEFPLITHGTEGSFYSHGISLGNAFEMKGRTYINFMGWHIPDNQHWMGKIGRLLLNDTSTSLTIDPDHPFIDLDQEDPVSLSYPWIHFDNDLYQMWYGSTVYWNTEGDEMLHIIKYASSVDGVNWRKMGEAVPHKLEHSQAFSRPSVIKHQAGYDMWFSYRGKLHSTYRIGYASSEDGIRWICDYENVGMDVSESGWDQEMICYPYVFMYNNCLYMLYNGNGYGKSGIGLAVLDSRL